MPVAQQYSLNILLFNNMEDLIFSFIKIKFGPFSTLFLKQKSQWTMIFNGIVEILKKLQSL